MGATGSKLERVLGDQFPDGERYFGLENFGNTCYCSSVLQSLYFCIPFREELLEYYANNKDAEENLLTDKLPEEENWCYCSKEICTVSKEGDHSFMHQDAHEFLNFLLNELVDILEKEAKAANSSPEALPASEKGILTNETRCLLCETVIARDETFLDLSNDIEQNGSITSCLKSFSSTEALNAEDKFFCDKCCSLQEAQKRMKIKKPPQILVIHLKRFKYIEQHGRYKKLTYRVVFPMELKLNFINDAESEYSLFAVVVHVGSGPNHGHHVCLVKSHNHWLYFDDENVEMMDESTMQNFFGSAQ